MNRREGTPGGTRHRGGVFEEEALTHLDAVYRFALRLSGSRATAEDLVQDTWLSALRRPPQSPAALRSWLSRVLHNRASTIGSRRSR